MKDALAPLLQLFKTGIAIANLQSDKNFLYSTTEMWNVSSLVKRLGSFVQLPRTCVGCFSSKIWTDGANDAANVPLTLI